MKKTVAWGRCVVGTGVLACLLLSTQIASAQYLFFRNNNSPISDRAPYSNETVISSPVYIDGTVVMPDSSLLQMPGSVAPGSTTQPQPVAAEPAPYWKDYINTLNQEIRANWSAQTLESQPSGRTVLELDIDKNGQLLGTRVTNSSGNTNYDQVAIDAVRRAAPFQPLPALYQPDHVVIKFTFDLTNNRFIRSTP